METAARDAIIREVVLEVAARHGGEVDEHARNDYRGIPDGTAMLRASFINNAKVRGLPVAKAARAEVVAELAARGITTGRAFRKHGKYPVFRRGFWHMSRFVTDRYAFAFIVVAPREARA